MEHAARTDRQTRRAATGRTFAINGDLNVRLARTPRITVDGLVLGNAAWAKEPRMAEIGRVDFTIDPLALWRGRVVLPELNVSEARVLLEKNADGAANWIFDGTERRKPRPAGDRRADARPRADHLSRSCDQDRFRDRCLHRRRRTRKTPAC